VQCRVQEEGLDRRKEERGECGKRRRQDEDAPEVLQHRAPEKEERGQRERVVVSVLRVGGVRVGEVRMRVDGPVVEKGKSGKAQSDMVIW
jgi:hypothetical protein